MSGFDLPSSEKRGWIDRLTRIDRRIIFLGVAIAVAIPVIHPMGLPVKPTRESIDFFTAIDTLQAGDVIVFSFDYGADVRAELDPMSLAVWQHCFEKDLRIVALTLYPDGVGIAEQIMTPVAEKYGKRYGVDYVFLGYNADWSGTMLRMGESFRKTYPVDQYGRATSEIRLLDDADRFADTPLLISMASSAYAEWWVTYAGGKFGQKVVTGNTAIQAVLIYPFYQSGQVLGFLGGLKGASEYEALTGRPGTATRGMDSQSTGHALMVLFILLGNFAYLSSRRRRTRRTLGRP
jgi:hypothetical protein